MTRTSTAWHSRSASPPHSLSASSPSSLRSASCTPTRCWHLAGSAEFWAVSIGQQRSLWHMLTIPCTSDSRSGLASRHRCCTLVCAGAGPHLQGDTGVPPAHAGRLPAERAALRAWLHVPLCSACRGFWQCGCAHCGSAGFRWLLKHCHACLDGSPFTMLVTSCCARSCAGGQLQAAV